MIKLEGIGKEMRPVASLKGWAENPRVVIESDLKRLKTQLGWTKGELFKPIIILEDGTVLGGNQRLKVLKEMGVEKVWVKIVHPKNEEEKIKYGLSDNGRAGAYREEDLRAQVTLADWDEDMQALFKADTSLPINIPAFLEKRATQTLGKDAEADKDTTKEKMDTYLNGDQKQVVLFFLEKDREHLESLFSDARAKLGAESNSEVILQLL